MLRAANCLELFQPFPLRLPRVRINSSFLRTTNALILRTRNTPNRIWQNPCVAFGVHNNYLEVSDEKVSLTDVDLRRPCACCAADGFCTGTTRWTGREGARRKNF